MATKSSVGWLILAFALAVPGVLFYQWFTHLDQEKKKALSMKVRLSESGLFQNSPKKDKLVNPIQPPAAAPAVSASTAAPAAVPAPAQAQGLSAIPAPVPAGAPVAAAPAAGAPAQSQTPAPGAAAADDPDAPKSTATANVYEAWRDPTLSPYDQVRIEQTLMEQQLRLLELKEEQEKKSRPAPRKPAVQIEKLIDLQGIVSAGGTNKAIVNNEVVGEGEMVKTSAGPVRVVRITSQAVGFVFKDKKFSKSVNR